MHRFAIKKGPTGHPTSRDRNTGRPLRQGTAVRSRPEIAAIFKKYDGIVCLAKLTGAFGNSFEHRANVGRRGSDHLENVAAAGLVGQRLREVARLRLHLVEQPRRSRWRSRPGRRRSAAAGRDGRRKGRAPPRDADDADQGPLAHQRDEQHAAKATQPGHFQQGGKFGQFDLNVSGSGRPRRLRICSPRGKPGQRPRNDASNAASASGLVRVKATM